jgi:tRNA dimethylallyltransferase
MGRPVPTKQLFTLVGPTAVGKTEISLEIASIYRCPIMSADSRQCYKELGVATAKPPSEMLSKVKHYFIDTHSIHAPVSAADFEEYALNNLEEIFQDHDFCIVTGGSGLYVKALCEGLDEMPVVPESVRSELEVKAQLQGLQPLMAQLKKLDPHSAETIDTRNPRRIIRALEVCLATGRPFSTFRSGTKRQRSFDIIKIGLQRDREELYGRINQRVNEMVSQGLLEEAQKLYKFRDKKPLQTVGYQEIFGYMDKQYDWEEAIRLLKRNSRRYAKRQLTWFSKDSEIHWFNARESDLLIQFLRKKTAPPAMN